MAGCRVEQVNAGSEHPCGSGVVLSVTLWGDGKEDPILPTQVGMGCLQGVLIGSIATEKVNLCPEGLLSAGWEM